MLDNLYKKAYENIKKENKLMNDKLNKSMNDITVMREENKKLREENKRLAHANDIYIKASNKQIDEIHELKKELCKYIHNTGVDDNFNKKIDEKISEIGVHLYD